MNFVIRNPLEQFTLYSVFGPITNLGLFGLIGLIVIILGVWYNKSEKVVVEREYIVKESLIGTVIESAIEQVGKSGYIPILVTLYFYIIVSNLIGMIPYSFTTTSHLVVTIGMSLPILIGVTIIGVQKWGSSFVGLFLPNNTPTWLIPLLMPIEIISYLARGMSLGVRLFANVVAGHALMHIIAGFTWKGISIITIGIVGKMVGVSIGISFIAIMIGLEMMIAYLQAIVFTTLTGSYIGEVK